MYAPAGFNGLMSFAFCFTAVNVLSSLCISMGACLLWSGGPTVMVWGWFVVSFFTIIVGCSMGEVCSTYPSAGSVYHWTGQLAPEKWAPLIAYICGWFNFMCVRA
jgi:amino acid transporter